VIYNFRIGCWVHFGFKISSLGRSNRAKSKCLALERGRPDDVAPAAPSRFRYCTRARRDMPVSIGPSAALRLLCSTWVGPGRCHAPRPHALAGCTASHHWASAPPHVAHCPRHTATDRRLDDYGYRLSVLLKP
jgi:hypothetical protein